MSIFSIAAGFLPTGFATALENGLDPNALAGVMAIIGALILVLIIVFVAVYIYSALVLMSIAKRTNTPNPWLAWIPVGNMYLLSQIAKMPWWPILLMVPMILFEVLSMIPVIGILFSVLYIFVSIAFVVFVYIWWWKVCEVRNRPGWYVLLSVIPIAGTIWFLVLMGILAWGKD